MQSDQRLTNISLKGIFNLPYEQKLSAGFDYRYDWLKAPMRVEGGKATDNTQAIYVQDEFALLDPLYLTAGLRLTRNQLQDPYPQGTALPVYQEHEWCVPLLR